jgi:hypothetical protein
LSTDKAYPHKHRRYAYVHYSLSSFHFCSPTRIAFCVSRRRQSAQIWAISQYAVLIIENVWQGVNPRTPARESEGGVPIDSVEASRSAAQLNLRHAVRAPSRSHYSEQIASISQRHVPLFPVAPCWQRGINQMDTQTRWAIHRDGQIKKGVGSRSRYRDVTSTRRMKDRLQITQLNSLSWEANNCSVLFMTPWDSVRFHNTPLPVPVVSQMNPIHTFNFY